MACARSPDGAFISTDCAPSAPISPDTDKDDTCTRSRLGGLACRPRDSAVTALGAGPGYRCIPLGIAPWKPDGRGAGRSPWGTAAPTVSGLGGRCGAPRLAAGGSLNNASPHDTPREYSPWAGALFRARWVQGPWGKAMRPCTTPSLRDQGHLPHQLITATLFRHRERSHSYGKK